MKTNLEYLIENKEKLDVQNHGVCGLCYKIKYGEHCDQQKNCNKCEFLHDIMCYEFLNKEYKETVELTKVELTKFEYDLLMSYISIYKEGDRIFCTRSLLQRMFILGYFVNVHPQLTLNEILERAMVKDAK